MLELIPVSLNAAQQPANPANLKAPKAGQVVVQALPTDRIAPSVSSPTQPGIVREIEFSRPGTTTPEATLPRETTAQPAPTSTPQATQAAALSPKAANPAIATRQQEIEQKLAEIVARSRQQQAAASPVANPSPSPNLGSGSSNIPSTPIVRSAGLNLNMLTALPYDLEVLAIMRAIIIGESSNNHRAVNPHSGALGYGQIMPSNLRSWSRAALGREVSRTEFLNDPNLQLQIIGYQINRYWQAALVASNGNEAIAVRRVASQWYSGRANLFNSSTPQYYGGYRYPSIAEYTLSALRRYQQAKQNLIALR